MKATLEIEVPRTCYGCLLSRNAHYTLVCMVILDGDFPRDVGKRRETRDPGCPLKIEEEGKKGCDTCKHNGHKNITNAVGNIVKHEYCLKNYGRTYRRKCGEWEKREDKSDNYM